ncbi:GNAT family N-acetyltransferase [uncultured Roseobacter sp.]|uniref:GNAT family N-acetyltransferase n=1 Tax=uncultured Roseobacter sp. TaxID=114847 RepID=UPI00261285F6|nr:GNAT family N-acetyltransferase [uncultured Roseobacter sp.]
MTDRIGLDETSRERPKMNKNIEVHEADPDSATAQALLKAGHTAMQAEFPKKRNVEFDPKSLAAGGMTLFIGYLDGEPVGCCALSLQPEFSELKKLYVTPSARGLGVAELLIRHVENYARTSGSKKIMLESGVRLHAAHRLYDRLGYRSCGAFGNHEPDPESSFFHKNLRS